MNEGRRLSNCTTYDGLGVRRVINAADTYTALGGGRLPSRVVDAMVAAASHHVDITELLASAGRRIAQLTHNPAALVVNSSAAALAICTAAAMAGRSKLGVDSLPHNPPSRREVVTFSCQKNTFLRAVSLTGATLVEVGYADSTPVWLLEDAIGERTAAVLWFAGGHFEEHAPSLEETVALAHAKSVPVIVDAAAQIPPVSNLWDYHERGADLVIFSGGKGLRGPQSSGLIVGDEELISACAAHSYPNPSIGRAMKTSKENIMGLVAAVELAIELDWDGEYQRWLGIAKRWEASLATLSGVTTWTVPSGRLGQTCPRTFLKWNWLNRPTAIELSAALAQRDPSIRIETLEGDAYTATLNPYSLAEGEDSIVLQAVIEEMRHAGLPAEFSAMPEKQ